MATFTLVTANLEALQYIPCIWYPIQSQNHKVQALIDSNSKIIVMTPAYIAKLGFIIQKTSIGAQKIDGLLLETYGIALTRFLV